MRGLFSHRRRTLYIEIGDDQYANRVVESFANGDYLSYDRDHWCDDYGMIIRCRFSLKQKWAKGFKKPALISQPVFEAQWSAAKNSPLWKRQVATSRAAELGKGFAV